MSSLADEYPRNVERWTALTHPTRPTLDEYLSKIEDYRVEHYPDCSRAAWDVVQAEELFDNDGAPLIGWAEEELRAPTGWLS